MFVSLLERTAAVFGDRKTSRDTGCNWDHRALCKTFDRGVITADPAPTLLPTPVPTPLPADGDKGWGRRGDQEECLALDSHQPVIQNEIVFNVQGPFQLERSP